jgi:preprotein translocase subunit YajC
MEAVIVLVFTFGLLWVLFILPQQRRVRAHQRLVMSLEEGDEVVLSAGIFGRITALGPEELDLEVAPGVELRVARQAVLRRVEHAVPMDESEEMDESNEMIEVDDLEHPAEPDSETEIEPDAADEAVDTDDADADGAQIDSADDGDNNAHRRGGNDVTL